MPEKSAEYKLSPKAQDDMEAVWLYSLSEWGAEQTSRYIDDLTASLEFLSGNPKSGTNSGHIRAGCRRIYLIHNEAIALEHMRLIAPLQGSG